VPARNVFSRFNGFGANAETVETVKEVPSSLLHRAKAAVLMKLESSLNQAPAFKKK
jgi:hypothetical protein